MLEAILLLLAIAAVALVIIAFWGLHRHVWFWCRLIFQRSRCERPTKTSVRISSATVLESKFLGRGGTTPLGTTNVPMGTGATSIDIRVGWTLAPGVEGKFPGIGWL